MCLFVYRKKNILLPLLFSYRGIAKTKISTGFDTSMVFKIVLLWMKRDRELLQVQRTLLHKGAKFFSLWPNCLKVWLHWIKKNIIQIKTESSSASELILKLTTEHNKTESRQKIQFTELVSLFRLFRIPQNYFFVGNSQPYPHPGAPPIYTATFLSPFLLSHQLLLLRWGKWEDLDNKQFTAPCPRTNCSPTFPLQLLEVIKTEFRVVFYSAEWFGR